MRFLDVFSGIGGFRMGLEQAGHTCIGHIEVNEYARQAYEAIYDIKDDEFDGKDVTAQLMAREIVECKHLGMECDARTWWDLAEFLLERKNENK